MTQQLTLTSSPASTQWTFQRCSIPIFRKSLNTIASTRSPRRRTSPTSTNPPPLTPLRLPSRTNRLAAPRGDPPCGQARQRARRRPYMIVLPTFRHGPSPATLPPPLLRPRTFTLPSIHNPRSLFPLLLFQPPRPTACARNAAASHSLVRPTPEPAAPPNAPPSELRSDHLTRSNLPRNCLSSHLLLRRPRLRPPPCLQLCQPSTCHSLFFPVRRLFLPNTQLRRLFNPRQPLATTYIPPRLPSCRGGRHTFQHRDQPRPRPRARRLDNENRGSARSAPNTTRFCPLSMTTLHRRHPHHLRIAPIPRRSTVRLYLFPPLSIQTCPPHSSHSMSILRWLQLITTRAPPYLPSFRLTYALLRYLYHSRLPRPSNLRPHSPLLLINTRRPCLARQPSQRKSFLSPGFLLPSARQPIQRLRSPARLAGGSGTFASPKESLRCSYLTLLAPPPPHPHLPTPFIRPCQTAAILVSLCQFAQSLLSTSLSPTTCLDRRPPYLPWHIYHHGGRLRRRTFISHQASPGVSRWMTPTRWGPRRTLLQLLCFTSRRPARPRFLSPPPSPMLPQVPPPA